MTDDLRSVLDDHAAWIKNQGGTRAYLRGANLGGANLSDADLSGANLLHADLSGANLSGANLFGANLFGADLSHANLLHADLSGANLRDANLRDANLLHADLSGANLRDANLGGANLSDADLGGADLSGANLGGADLSGAKNILAPADYLQSEFERDEMGVICYKAIGLHYRPPDHWAIEPGAVLEEVCNPLRTLDCACGVNVGTRGWVRQNAKAHDVWRCRIAWIDLSGVVVPYNTDGKIRCERVTLIEKVDLEANAHA